MSLSTERIVELYNKGFSCKAIKKMDGRAINTIRNILIRQGIQLRSRSEAIKKFPTDLAIRLYNLGLNAEQIGELLGVHQTTVIKRFSSIDFPMRTHGVAIDIGFSKEEFEKFFLNDRFLDAVKAE